MSLWCTTSAVPDNVSYPSSHGTSLPFDWYQILLLSDNRHVCELVAQEYGIVGFNVPLDTLWVILVTILWVRWPNQQCHSTEGRWIVNHIKGQSHQAQLTIRQREGCKQKIFTICIAPWTLKTDRCLEDRAEPSKIKARYSRPTCKNCSYLWEPL